MKTRTISFIDSSITIWRWTIWSLKAKEFCSTEFMLRRHNNCIYSLFTGSFETNKYYHRRPGRQFPLSQRLHTQISLLLQVPVAQHWENFFEVRGNTWNLQEGIQPNLPPSRQELACADICATFNSTEKMKKRLNRRMLGSHFGKNAQSLYTVLPEVNKCWLS